MRLPSSRRAGLSLLEVLVALALFLMALVGLEYLVTLGGQLALGTRQRSEAAQLCQSKMDEVAAGAVPLSSQSDVPFDEAPDYHWSLDAEQGSVSGLWNVTVRVSRQQVGSLPVECSISRMLLDPSLVGSTQDTPPSSTSGTTSSNSGGSGTSSTSASSSQGTATGTSSGR
jgi:Tfp pilus assembly protein PilV